MSPYGYCLGYSSCADSSTAGGYYYSDCDSTSASGTLTISGSASTSDTWSNTWIYITSYEPVEVKPETKAEARARQKREREYQIRCERERKRREREQRELQKEKEAAIAKAEELLREYVGKQTYEKMLEFGYLELESHKYEGCKYRIPSKSEDFIEIVDKDGKVIDTLCVHSPGDYPMYDKVLARYVRLALDEGEILRIANSHGARQRSAFARVV